MPGPKGEECRLCYYWGKDDLWDDSPNHRLCHKGTIAHTTTDAHWCGKFICHPDKAEFVWIGDTNGRDEVREISKT